MKEFNSHNPCCRSISTLIMKLLPIAMLIISLIFSAPAYAFKPEDHMLITRDALSQIVEEVQGKQLRFSIDAISEINEANVRTDDAAFQTQADLHFDNEDFLGGSRRLLRWRERTARKIIESKNGKAARIDLGSALHTVQDFYSHSNWVELGFDSLNQDLGRNVFAGAGKEVATCPNDPGKLGGRGMQELTSGYFLINRGLCGVPNGKCRHGVELLCPDGINKDSRDNPNHLKAKHLAELATIDYVNQIISDVKASQNLDSLLLLFGQG